MINYVLRVEIYIVWRGNDEVGNMKTLESILLQDIYPGQAIVID